MPADNTRVSQTRQVALGADKPEQAGILLAFGGNLKSLRTEAGFSQEQLAARCFTSRGHRCLRSRLMGWAAIRGGRWWWRAVGVSRRRFPGRLRWA